LRLDGREVLAAELAGAFDRTDATPIRLDDYQIAFADVRSSSAPPVRVALVAGRHEVLGRVVRGVMVEMIGE